MTDVDASSQTGIAIIDADTTNGTWWYTTDGGTNWNALGAVSDSSARVLNASSNTRIYFQSDADFNGTINNAIEFRAWDRSQGPSGSLQDASANGGTTAFSSATETADLVITAVNDAPVASAIEGSALAYTENDGAVSVTSTIAFNDVDDTHIESASVGFTAGYNSGEDSLTFVNQNGISGSYNNLTGTWTLTGSATLAEYETAIRSITYTNSSEIPDTTTRTVSFTVNDGDNNSNTLTRDITIGSVNDTPIVVGPGSAFAANEQANLSIEGTGFSVSDVDAAAGTMTATMTVGEGSIALTAGNSGVTITANNADTVTFTGTLTQIDNLLTGASTGTITYQNGSDTPTTSTTIALTVNDGGNTGTDPGATGDGSSEEDSASQTINVTLLNDDPTNAGSLPSDLVVTEDVLSNVDLSAIDFSDVDAGSSSLTVTLSTSTGGQLFATSGAGVTVGGSPTAMTFTGTLTDLNAYFDIASNIQYQHGTLHTFGDNADTITVVINDNGNTGTGGGTDQSFGTANVDITAVNDAPVIGTNTGTTVAEGGSVTITTAMLNEADVDDAGAGLTYTVTSSPTNGQLELTTGPGVAITSFTQDDIDNNRVIFVHDGTQAAADSFDFSLADGGEDGAVAATATFNFTVTNVNDAPVLTLGPGGGTYNENATGVFVDSGASITDDDNMDFDGGQLTTTITNNGTTDDRLIVRHEGTGAGQVEVNSNNVLIDGVIVATFSGGNGAGDPLVITFNTNANAAEVESVAQRVSYHSVSENPSELQRTISMQLTDGDGGTSNLETRTENVVAINDTPVATSPATLTATEQTNLDLTGVGFSVSDADSTSADITVTLGVGEGVVLGTSGDSGVVISGSSSATITLTGTAAEINDLLGGTSTGTLNYFNSSNDPSASTTLTLTVNDGGNYGVDPGLTADGTSEEDASATTINITPVNDAPFTGASTTSGNEDANSISITLGGSDSDGTIENFVLSSLPANGTLYTDSGLTNAATTGTDIPASGGTLTLYFDPDQDWNGTTTFEYAAKDDAGLQDPTDATGTITVDPINDAPTVATNNTLSVTEGDTGQVIPTTLLNEGDVDDDGAEVTYRVTTLPANGTLRLNGTALSANDTFTQDDIDNNRVTYDHDGGETSSDAFVFDVLDGGEDGAAPLLNQTFNISVAPFNDGLVLLTNTGIATNEGTTVTITNSHLNSSDSDDAPSERTYTITTPTINGYLQLSTNAGVPITNFTQADIDSGVVQYVHDDSETTSDSFGFSLADGLEDGAAPVTGTFAITVNLVNDHSITAVSDSNANANEVSENSAVNSPTGITAFASDGDITDTIAYSLTDDDGGRFQIDSVTGLVTVSGAIDREADGPSRSITVRATSSDGSSTTQTFNITINDVDEFDVTTIVDSDPSSQNVNENAGNGTVVGYTAFAIDNDASNSNVTYTLDDDAGGRFSIDSNSGEVTVADGTQLDREAAASHDITIRAASDDGSFNTQLVTIYLNDVDEFDIGTITDSDAGANSVLENSAIGTTVSMTAFATDADATNNSVTYSLADSAGGRFAIDTTTGEVTVAGSLNFELVTSHSISVQATSSDGSTVTQSFTINVLDSNDAPVAANDVQSTLVLQGVVLDPTTNDFDEDGNPLSVVIVTGPANGVISTDGFGNLVYTPNTGFIGTDFITYQATDGSLNSNSATIEVAVTAAAAPPPPPEPTDPIDPPDEPSDLDTVSEPDPEPEEDGGDETALDEEQSSSSASLGPAPSQTSQQAESESTENTESFIGAVSGPGGLGIAPVLADSTYESSGAYRRAFGSNYFVFASQSMSLDTIDLQAEIDFAQVIVWDEWEEQNSIAAESQLDYFVGSAASVASVFSLGYVFWALRGGAFLAAFSTSIPSWRLIDPTSLLTAYRGTQSFLDDEVERILD